MLTIVLMMLGDMIGWTIMTKTLVPFSELVADILPGDGPLVFAYTGA